ncbi:hypothetical protein BDB01DRAFT_89854 [Pilobolus umbonatus]|nr:hypothetical protein BDB01DRAFT_89854 [Pilobolus umbonatus]
MSNNNKISGRNPKGAALDSSHYESQDIVDCFQPLIEPLTHALQPYQKDIYLTARDLSSLIGQIQQFQQDCLGAFNRPPQAPVRIPAKLFKVNKPNLLNSAIYTILFAAYHYRISHGWKKWDWTNPAKKQKNADLIRAIRQQLIQQNWIVVPKIALHESIPESAIGTVMSYVQQIEGK